MFGAGGDLGGSISLSVLVVEGLEGVFRDSGDHIHIRIPSSLISTWKVSLDEVALELALREARHQN